MLLYFKTILLGIIQGLTEFLPISSTGHLIIAEEFLPLPSENFRQAFLVFVQLGSILAVLVYFRRELFPVPVLRELWGRRPWGGHPESPAPEGTSGPLTDFCQLWLKVLLGVVPVMGFGYLLGEFIQSTLYSVWMVALALLLGGIALLILEGRKRPIKAETMASLTYLQAVSIGLVQCIAMIPGISRSASTIIGALFVGCSRGLAVEYSFFLAIPTMLAASCYSLLKKGAALSGPEWGGTAVGFLTAFLVSWWVIAFLMGYIRRRNFRAFGWYRIALAGVLILWQLLKMRAG